MIDGHFDFVNRVSRTRIVYQNDFYVLFLGQILHRYIWIKTRNEDNIYICLFILVNFVQIEKLPMNEFHEDLT